MKNKLTVIISSITMLLVLIVMCTYQLKVDKVAVLTTFGTPNAISKPGLYFRFPWPVQKLVKLDSRKQLLIIKEKEVLTKDNINLIVKMFVAWSITEGDENTLKFYKSLGETSEEAEKYLTDTVASKQGLIIRKFNLNDFLNAGGKTKIEQIEKELKESINADTMVKYGITIHKVSITRLNLHEANSISVLEKMKQGQLKKAEEITSIALKESQIMKNSANEKAQKLIANSEAEAKTIRSKVLVQSAELFSRYENEQEFALFLRKLDAIKETTKSQTTFFLNPDIPPFDLFMKKGLKAKENK
jgi:modulator of FtsH protease HflC